MNWLGLLILLTLVGCQQKPTLGVTESGVLVQNKDYRKVITETSLVFDTRSPFDFNISKVPGSINLPISDFKASLDPLDAARRLSLYGVSPASSVVIIGDGKGDEQKLAWEFIKLGVTDIETLNASVFRMMNVKPEAAKKNVTLWKPKSEFAELDQKDFVKKINSLRPKITTQAKSEVYQGFPVAKALRDSVLVVTATPEWSNKNDYLYADHLYFAGTNLIDEKGLLNRFHLQNQNIKVDLKKYNVVFLIDSSPEKYSRAYALTQFGARSLLLVP